MKNRLLALLKGLVAWGWMALIPHLVQAQGRVVINEYMPWPGSTCGTTAEFVELLNFGPGPMNIGCYMLTDGDYSSVFPMSYILAIDSNQNGQFDTSDNYISGIASTSSTTIEFEGLQAGNYRLTLASAKGCDLRTFPFTIYDCWLVVLPLKLRFFEAERNQNDVLFSWILEEVQLADRAVLEGSINGIDFQPLEELGIPPEGTGVWSDRLSIPVSPDIRFVRLKMISRTQEQNWSPTLLLRAYSPATTDRIYPNPTSGQATIEAFFPSPGLAEIKLIQATGSVLRQFRQPVKKGVNQVSIDLQSLPKGLYLVQLQDLSQPGIRSFRVSKY